MLQAPMFDGFSFDPFSLLDDGTGPTEVGTGGRNVVQALVAAPVVVVLEERLDLGFEVAGQEVVFQPGAVVHSLVPALDHRTVACTGTTSPHQPNHSRRPSQQAYVTEGMCDASVRSRKKPHGNLLVRIKRAS